MRARIAVAVAACCHFALIVGLWGGALRPLFNDSYNREGPGADFRGVYVAGKRVAAGESPYPDPGQRVFPDYYPFRYLPVVAQTLGRALCGLSVDAAFGTWLLVLEVLFVGCLFALRRLFASAEHADLVTVTGTLDGTAVTLTADVQGAAGEVVEFQLADGQRKKVRVGPDGKASASFSDAWLDSSGKIMAHIVQGSHSLASVQLK